MKRRRTIAVFLLGACLVAGGFGVRAGSDEETVTAGVREFRTDDGRFIDARLPGTIVSHVVATTAEGGREIWFLLAPVVESEPRETPEKDEESSLPPCPEDRDRVRPRKLFYRLDVGGAGSLALVDDDLPADALSIRAADLDGDGADDPLLVGESGLFLFDGDALQPLIEEPDLHWAGLAGRPIVLGSTAQGIRLYGPRKTVGKWEVLGEVDLPAGAWLSGSTLRLSRTLPSAIAVRDDGSLLLAAPPGAAGKHRVKATVIEVATGGEVSVVETWSRLPSAENVLERHVLIVDDLPMLLVSTKTAGKLALFDEKMLRLYPVERDRTRLGLPPRFAANSHMNLWQEAVPSIVDVNSDGLDDLVVGYWKGLTSARVVLDAYVREADGSFLRSVRTTAFDVKDGDRALLMYGEDLDGDGLGDLLIRSNDGLRLHRGLRSKNGSKLVERAAREIPLGASEDDDVEGAIEVSVGSAGGFHVSNFGNERRPFVEDLDGDGRKEIYLVDLGNGTDPARFQAAWLNPPTPRRE